MRRRDLLISIASVLAWPAQAQAPTGARRIGILMNPRADDLEAQARAAIFVQELAALGWVDGHNVRIEFRWAGGDPNLIRKYAAELIALSSDVILATGGFGVAPLLQVTRTVPIVFVSVADPIGSGFVASLPRPGGNITGFANFEYGISAKWLELLKQLEPRITRAAVVRDAAVPAGTGFLGAMQSVAPFLGVELTPIGVANADEVQRALAAFAREPAGGLIVTPSAAALTHRELIINLAAQHRLPAVFPYRFYAAEGGLASYGPDTTDQFRRAAAYVDRILNGESPAALPVQAPTKFELVINLRTASALDLTIPPTLLARADEVIE